MCNLIVSTTLPDSLLQNIFIIPHIFEPFSYTDGWQIKENPKEQLQCSFKQISSGYHDQTWLICLPQISHRCSVGLRSGHWPKTTVYDSHNFHTHQNIQWPFHFLYLVFSFCTRFPPYHMLYYARKGLRRFSLERKTRQRVNGIEREILGSTLLRVLFKSLWG